MFFESLENRSLLSTSAVSTPVQNDETAIHTELQKFKSDITSFTSTMVADGNALQADDVKQDATLAPLFKQLHKDVKSMRSGLGADLLTESKAVIKDDASIIKELVQLAKDKRRSNSTEATADRTALKADRVQLQTDEVAGLNARLSTRQSYDNTLSADLDKIKAAAAGNTTGTVAADVTKFATDRNAVLSGMEGDLQTLSADRTQLITDLTSSQNLT